MIIPVTVQQGVGDVTEEVGVFGREIPAGNLINGLLQLRQPLVILHRVVSPLGQGLHLLHRHAKDEDVLVAHLLAHLHIGTIQRANSQGTIGHELHVARAGSFCAGCGDLLAQVGSWDDFLGQGYTIVGQVDALQPLANDGVIVDRAGHVVEELDDQLGHVVARGSLQVISKAPCSWCGYDS